MSEYKERDLIGLDKAGNYYCKHVAAMTKEDLRSKSDIAAELGHRDMVIDTLRQQNAELVELLDLMFEESEYLRESDLVHSGETLDKVELLLSKIKGEKDA